MSPNNKESGSTPLLILASNNSIAGVEQEISFKSEQHCPNCSKRRKGQLSFGSKAMKILQIVFILGLLLQGTTEFLLPTASLLLATEEFIEHPKNPALLPEDSPSTEEPLSSSQVKVEDEPSKGTPEAHPPPLPTSEDAKTPPPPVNSQGSHHHQEGEEDTQIPKDPSPTAAPTLPAPPLSQETDQTATKNVPLPLIPSDEPQSQGNKNEGSSQKELSGAPPSTPNENLVIPSAEMPPPTPVVKTSSEKDDSKEVSSGASGGIEEGSKGRLEEVLEEPIPSFMEWTQKKQQELLSNSMGTQTAGQQGIPSINNGLNNNNNKNNGQQGQALRNQQNGSKNASSGSGSGVRVSSGGGSGGSTAKIDAKNFASPDCGAKIIQSSPALQNPNGVLSPSRDDYMLHQTGMPFWVVIELCEPLTIQKISVGNVELFSSSPKEIEFGISDRYPTRDWVKLGPFSLPDEKDVHPITLPSTNSSTFGKFVKVSILSHYGSEHYCVVSFVRVNGKSEYEVLESETTHQEDVNKEENALFEEHLEYEEPPTSQPQGEKTSGGGGGGGIKETVLKIFNKAVQAIKPGSSVDTSDGSIRDSWLKSRCKTVIQCIPQSELEPEIYSLLACNSSDLLPFLKRVSKVWCGWDYCHAAFSHQSIGSPWQPEGFFASLFGGPFVLHALCHYHKPQTVGCGPAGIAGNYSFSDSSSTSHVENGHIEGYANESNIIKDKSIENDVPTTQDGDSKPIAGTSQEPKIGETTGKANGGTESPPEEQLEAPTPLQGEGVPPPPSPIQPQETQIPSPQNPNQQQQQEETFSQGNQQQNQGGTQKESVSVFQRFSNRVKTLERNQSLTATYLDELSRRFKKQTEESTLVTESNKKRLNETRLRLLSLEEYYRYEVQSLRRNLDDVRDRLLNVQVERGFLVIFCFAQFLLTLWGYFWVKRRLRQYESRLETGTAAPSPLLQQPQLQDPLSKVKVKQEQGKPFVSSVGRKRSNSDVTLSSSTDKTKKMKKKNKQKNMDGKVFDKGGCFKGIPTSQSSGAIVVGSPKMGSAVLGTPPPSKSPISLATPPPSLSILPISKENIDPRSHPTSIRMGISLSSSERGGGAFVTPPTSTNSSSPLNNTSSPFNGQRPNSLSTGRVTDSTPFSFQSSLSSYLDSGVSTSGRFAILASPGPDPESPARSLKGVDGEASTLDQGRRDSTGYPFSNNYSSTSATTDRMGTIKSIVNGYSSRDDSSLGSKGIATSSNANGSGKKTKKSGLKAFMPKLFDR